jgi:hypothetical protein
MTLMEKCHFTFASCVSLGSFPQCVGDRILNTICRSRTMDLGLHIAVHARKKSFLRHTARLTTKLRRESFVKFDKIRSFLVFLEHWQHAFL